MRNALPPGAADALLTVARGDPHNPPLRGAAGEAGAVAPACPRQLAPMLAWIHAQPLPRTTSKPASTTCRYIALLKRPSCAR